MAGLSPTPEDGKIAGDGVFASNEELLEDLEFGKKVRFQKLIDLSKATKTFITKKGEVVTSPDNFIQLNATKELCKLAGDYPAEKHDVGGEAFTSLAQYVEALEKASAITARVTDEPAKQPD